MAQAAPANLPQPQPQGQNSALAAMLAPQGMGQQGMPPPGMGPPGMGGMPPGGGPMSPMLSPNAVALQLQHRNLPWYAIPGMIQQPPPPPPMMAPPAAGAAMAPNAAQPTPEELQAAMAFGGANTEGG